jgi:two-component system, OmpR family, sensor histidine kinase ChvG
MPGSAIDGQRKVETRRRLRWARSLAAKTALLAVIFLLVPVFLYLELWADYEQGQSLLLRSVRDEGRVISQSLLPMLQNADTGSLPELGEHLARFASQVTTIELLLAPAAAGSAANPDLYGASGVLAPDAANSANGFYYVASWPTVAPANLQAQRETLIRQGVLDRLAQNCKGEMPFSLIYHRPTGGDEVVTAVTPLATAAGCWAVVASFPVEAFPAAHLGEPYWATPTMRIAALIYLAMAAITFSTLLSIRGGLRRFALRARHIHDQGPDAGSFADRADLPELAIVAAEFDRMVDALHRSAAEIRLTAEENAHAFKTPIAVVRQSLEPLRRALAPDNRRAQRALGVVEQALDRLDGLVASARRLDEAAADLIDEPQIPVDLGRVIGRLIQSQAPILDSRGLKIVLASRGLTLTADLLPGMLVLGGEEMIETVLENLIENAVSFSPAGSEILIHLMHDGRFAHLTVSDQGPGVPAGQIARIFDRYYSERREEAAVETPATYFGIGLWIARRNVEVMGGTITAENRVPCGLTVHIRLPLASGRG